ncbi:DUF3139 domain-containing protein [Bacillus testis]|uniref:DUF3139 domain-containing protein n=1 Tax=Bacillus testis TaxID=1622072 RepID=UPI00067E723E|nr:DUF3139 domain-containing protein [Bacillus testis]
MEKAKLSKGTKVALIIFAIVEVIVLLIIGTICFIFIQVKMDKHKLEEATASYLQKTYEKDEIKSIEVFSTTPGPGNYEARVIFTDEPTHIYYYVLNQGKIVQRENPSVRKTEYNHLE